MTRLVLTTLAVLAVASAACGGVENEPNLAQAIEKTESTGSSRFEIDGFESVDGKRNTIACEGEADYARERLEVECDYGDLGRLELIAIGPTTYWRGTAALGIGLDGPDWAKDEGGEVARELSPDRLLSMLRAASSQTERVGEEDVREVATVRYRLDVSCAKVEPQLDCEGTTPVEVWIDEEGLVRRIVLEDSSESGTFEFYDFGVRVDIAPPPPDQVQDASDLAAVTSCETGVGSPISDGRLLEALRAHGFDDVERLDECPKGARAMFGSASMRPADPILFCQVAGSQLPDASTSATETEAGGGAVHQLANVKCTLVVNARGEPVDDASDRLRDVFADLEREVHP
jgi:hypothetical protein